MTAWHQLDANAALSAIAADATHGLDEAEVARRRARHGRNVLPEPASRSLLSVFARQLKSPLIYLLLVAAGVAVALGERIDAIVILVVVVVNAVIGAVQEGRAERAVKALRRLAQHRARVVRQGHDAVIDAPDVVPGDILVLEAGDAVAADARVLQVAGLRVAEAALTGESVPVA